MSASRLRLSIAAASVLSVASPVFAGFGDRDCSFGAAGTVTLTGGFGFPLSAVAEPSGDLLLRVGFPSTASNFYRVSAGGNSQTKLPNAAINFGVNDPTDVLLADGRILSINGSGNTFVPPLMSAGVTRYLSTGAVDTSFGTNGVGTVPGLTVAFAGPVVLPDGRILIGGVINGVAGLARFNADGTPDTTFGDGGAVTNSAAGTHYVSIAVQTDGRVVATSWDNLVRHEANGALDTTFGASGMTALAGLLRANRLRLQPSGKILVVGTQNQSSALLRLARFTTTGVLDLSVGGGTGYRDVSVPSGSVRSGDSALSILGDGRPLITGETSVDRGAIVRYTTDLADEVTVALNFTPRGTFVLPTGRIIVGEFSGQRAHRLLGDADPATCVPTTATLTSSPNPSANGQAVTLTAQVSAATGTPTGTVQFTDGSSNLGSPVSLSGGVATLNVSTLAVGAHALTAAYSGASGLSPSTSAVLNHSVTALPPVVWTPTTGPLITGTAAALGGTVIGDGGATITERGVVYSLTATNADPLLNGVGVTKTTVSGTTGAFSTQVNGLQPVSAYTFKAYATNATGTGYSPVATFTTFATGPGTPPDAPTMGLASPGDGSASVAFSPPANNGGTAIALYTVTCARPTLGELRTATGTSSPIVVTGLTNLSTFTCTVVATNAVGHSPPSATLTVVPGLTGTATPRLVNISTRGFVSTGNEIMIGGFIVAGDAPKQVLIRGRGPSMSALGVPGTLGDPAIRLLSGSTPLESNDNWPSALNAAAITASGQAPTDPKESAILTTVSPGLPYTVHLSGVGETTGIGIVEVFEMDKPEAPLLNLSTRGLVQAGDNVMIGGFIVQGSAPQLVLIIAKGPSLGQAPFNVPGALPDPTLELFQAGSAAPVAWNDDWGASGATSQIQASGNAPTNPLESAILRFMSPGAYTAIVKGKNGAQGVALVEVYKK